MLGKKVNDAEKVSPENSPKPSKSRGSGLKFKLACLGVFIILIGCCVSMLGFLWFGGYVEEWACTTVKENSEIWKQIDCKSEIIQKEGDGQFQYDVINQDQKQTIISDVESIVTDVVESSSPAVVGIGINQDNPGENQIIGSGFIVTQNGLIVTNQHVVSEGDAKDYFVVLKDQEEPLNVTQIYRDEINDIAIIRIEGSDLPTIPLGNSDNLKVGQTVVAIGNPLGSLTGTVTSGIISAVNRDVQISQGFFGNEVESYEDVIQTDAAVNPGNSGGPLINSNGEVIGINFATIQGADNLSFAIPINRVKTRIEELNKYGYFRIPFLGVEYRGRLVIYEGETVTGAVIATVIEDSPAAKAGLQRGDIIIEFDGKRLDDQTLFSLIQKSEIGKEIEVKLVRDKKLTSITVEIGERGDYN